MGHTLPDSGIISNLGCIILGCLCGEVVVGSKDELIGSEDEDDDGVDDDEAVDEPKHGSGSSPGESRILGRPRFLLTMSTPEEGPEREGKARPEIGGGSLEAEDANAEVDTDDDAEECGGGAFGLCKGLRVR